MVIGPTEMFRNGSVTFRGAPPFPKIRPGKECARASLRSEYIRDATVWIVTICFYSISFFYVGQVAKWATLRNAEQFRKGLDKTGSNSGKSKTEPFDSEQLETSSSSYTQEADEEDDVEVMSLESLWKGILEKLRHRLAALHLIKQSDIIHVRKLASGGLVICTVVVVVVVFVAYYSDRTFTSAPPQSHGDDTNLCVRALTCLPPPL